MTSKPDQRPTLAERIADAEAAGNHRLALRLKAAMSLAMPEPDCNPQPRPERTQ